MNVFKKSTIEILLLLNMVLAPSFAQDPNFHIYLAFGQSNMDGAGDIEQQDRIEVSPRFRNLSGVNCPGREVGEWYAANTPLCRCTSGLSPIDYFGRTLVQNLPEHISVGVAIVAVAGSKIELFDKYNHAEYADTAPDWMQGWIDSYNRNPYARMVELGKMAQQSGVIKGILLHQGESNNNERAWLDKVKLIYDNLMVDLNLDPSQVPILAGETVTSEQGGYCGLHNGVIADLHTVIPNAHVVSAAGLPHKGDGLHFSSQSYRTFGERYANKMLELLSQEPLTPPTPENIWLEAECGAYGENWQRMEDAEASNGVYLTSQPGLNNLNTPSLMQEDIILWPFKVDSAQTFRLYGRVNLPTANDDSFWLQIDDGEWHLFNNVLTNGWEWVLLNEYNLEAGNHSLRLTYREDGAYLDKLIISNRFLPLQDLGENVQCEDPVISVGLKSFNESVEVTKSEIKGSTLTLELNNVSGDYLDIKVISMDGSIIGEANHISHTNQVQIPLSQSARPGVYYVVLKSSLSNNSNTYRIQIK
jgi:hypothetical protein